jgi:endonuclease-3 related protein
MRDGAAEDRIRRIESVLRKVYGPQHWWPSDTAFETMVGAVLTQGTAWTNVEHAIDALGAADALSSDALATLTDDRLRDLIRPAGFFRRKSRTLKRLVAAVRAEAGTVEAFLTLPTDRIRAVLLSIGGIGPETADAILLYAAGRPVFPVDAYARRLFSRHDIVEPSLPYETLRRLVERAIGPEPAALNEFHALIVRVGKDFCRAAPRCGGCPLEGL